MLVFSNSGVILSPQAHSFVRDWSDRNLDVDTNSLRIIYGGSVNADNCQELAACNDVDGFLVGSAALRGPDFVAICNSQHSTAD